MLLGRAVAPKLTRDGCDRAADGSGDVPERAAFADADLNNLAFLDAQLLI
jgi:hypothetical protein